MFPPFSDLFQGYGIQNEKNNMFYKTTSSDYGWFTPSPHTVPIRYLFHLINENELQTFKNN